MSCSLICGETPLRREQFLKFLQLFMCVGIEIDVSLFAHPAGFLGWSENAGSMFALLKLTEYLR
jgi:hypothetical protein